MSRSRIVIILVVLCFFLFNIHIRTYDGDIQTSNSILEERLVLAEEFNDDIKKLNHTEFNLDNEHFLKSDEVAEVKPNKQFDYTESEYELICKVVNAEGRGQSDLFQQCVAQVIINRMKSGRFQPTIHKVVYRKGQYQCTWNGGFKIAVTDKVKNNVRLVMDGYKPCPENVVWQAEFTQGVGTWKLIHNTYFCY